MAKSTKNRAKVTFATEARLVKSLKAHLTQPRTPWGRLQTVTEWDYQSGITDLLARTPKNELIAFEAKLSDWRRACFQAYRNTVFAVRAYVVLPDDVAKRASLHGETFARYGIGLCACGSSKLKVLIEAPQKKPLMQWLANRAHTTFDGMQDAESNRLIGRRRNRLQAA